MRKIPTENEILDALIFFGYKLAEINNKKYSTENEFTNELYDIKDELDRKISPFHINIENIEILDDAIIYTFYLWSKEEPPEYYAWMKIYRSYDGYKYGFTNLIKKIYQQLTPFTFLLTKNFIKKTKIGEFTSINRWEVVNKLFHRLVDAEQKKDGSLQREISKIIGELEENFEDRLKLDYQIFLHVLKKTAQEFNLL